VARHGTTEKGDKEREGVAPKGTGNGAKERKRVARRQGMEEGKETRKGEAD
jgi:hypothetical protein